MLFLLEEEKLARDVYESLYAKWGAAAFSNIAASEQRHMDTRSDDSWRNMDWTLPRRSTRGVSSTTTTCTNLYKDLIKKGDASLEAAYQVGVDIEVLDIEDLEALIASLDRTDIRRVAGNLLRASEKHLDAFSSLVPD